ncbi:glycoside hydrolase family 16 protein [Pseudobacteriovorax antillogorgiicola]|uniref:Glycosyl hydrolases family 16 n=1 Tax=Pseudobacteriovorax antillogorgiicola TaxID=1513793 RepID=A0A1Y6C3P8_9BACT|nr:family 16 glycosylhydrolase [Pseudobacteriovorax antillogorgiicola]TCS49776.1 glycosyl hydrolase family 16 [Pseudobacteriovorax antillogorgiicola]SMF42786.1 Glycosyl hydrolases family 16 [Pseudobacteriovorax antillogorgiicola]
MRFRYFLSLAACVVCSSTFAKPYVSGEIVSQESYKYGRYEARMKAGWGSGTITAFFLMKDGSWLPGTEWQELDFEIFGKGDGTRFQSQIMTPGDPRTQNNEYHRSETTLDENYHVYTIDWAPDYLAFYLDGQLMRYETDTETYNKFFDANRVEPMQLRLTYWAGDSAWSGRLDTSSLPSYVEVDWIKRYRWDNGEFVLDWVDEFDSFDYSRWTKAAWTFEYAVNDFTPESTFTLDSKLFLRLAPR